MRISFADLMGEAYAETHGPGHRHDAKTQELERRRREVMRDYAGIQKARPIERAETADNVEDAVLVSP